MPRCNTNKDSRRVADAFASTAPVPAADALRLAELCSSAFPSRIRAPRGCRLENIRGSAALRPQGTPQLCCEERMRWLQYRNWHRCPTSAKTHAAPDEPQSLSAEALPAQ